MKKLILFLAILLSISCLWNTQGRASECPKEHPFLIKEWKNENCPEFHVYPLSGLHLLEFPKWEEMSMDSFLGDSECEKKENITLCQKLLPIFKKRTEIKSNGKWSSDERRKLENDIINQLLSECGEEKGTTCQQLKKIKEKLSNIYWDLYRLEEDTQGSNSKINEINQISKEKNDSLKKKKEIIDRYNDKCRMEFNFDHHDYTVGVGIAWGFNKDSTLLQNSIAHLNQLIEYRSKEIEKVSKRNLSTQNTNTAVVLTNIKTEKENNITISEFEKFYTPEKEKQLLAEYEKAVSENCVGCDYPQPLNISEYKCKECPNREFVNDKCVLKKELKKESKNDR